MQHLISFVRRRPLRSASAVVAVAIVALALALFEPWQLWIDKKVDEAAPQGASVVAVADAVAAPTAGAATPSSGATADPAPAPAAVVPTTAVPVPSRFVSLDHTTSGALVVLRNTAGEVYVRFEDLRTDNGPDVKVYLSANPVDGPEGAFDDEFVNLGGLKGNIGSQNYEVPAGTDLRRFRSVVIWCDRFDSAFGAAPLPA